MHMHACMPPMHCPGFHARGMCACPCRLPGVASNICDIISTISLPCPYAASLHDADPPPPRLYCMLRSKRERAVLAGACAWGVHAAGGAGGQPGRAGGWLTMRSLPRPGKAPNGLQGAEHPTPLSPRGNTP